MASDLDSFVEGVKYRIAEEIDRDTVDIEEERIVNFITSAVKSYNRIVPNTAATAFAGNGTAYEWSLPGDWVDGFSEIMSVEYPSGEQNPTYIKSYKWRIHQGTASKKFRLLLDVPSSTQTVNIVYTIPHTVTVGSSTLPQQDEEALQDLAAAYCFSEIAAKWSRTSKSTLEGDIINNMQKVDYYKGQARDLENRFKAHFGIRPGDLGPTTQCIGEWDHTYEWGTDFIVHQRNWR